MSANTEEIAAAYETLIADLGSATGLPELAPDAEGSLILTADDDLSIEIDFDDETESTIFSCEIGAISNDQMELWYPYLLEANVYWSGTNGATLGMAQPGGEVILSRSIRIPGLASQTFCNLVEGFLNSASAWKEKLQSLPPTPGLPVKDDDSSTDEIVGIPI